jgi:hypothetical protein
MSRKDSIEAVRYYEDQARKSLPGQVREILQINLYSTECDEEYNRIFRSSSSLPFLWPQELKKDSSAIIDTVEVDFWAQCDFAVTSIPERNKYSVTASSNVNFTTSHSYVSKVKKEPPAPKSVKTRTSPVKSPTAAPKDRKYVIMEISSGTVETLKNKISQLERSLLIARAKSGFQNILYAVGFCGIVGSIQDEAPIMNHIKNDAHSNLFPLVKTLFNYGRFVYVYNGQTIVKLVTETKIAVDVLKEKFDDFENKFDDFENKFDDFENKFGDLENKIVDMDKRLVSMERMMGDILEMLRQSQPQASPLAADNMTETL